MQAKKRWVKPTENVWHWLTTLFFTAALAAIVVLLASDALRHLRFTVVHQRLAALPWILIGLSYVCLQMSARHPRGELVKGLLLGLAFIL